MPDPDLSGRTAVVTGASSGIGRAIAERLGGAGATVVLAGRTEAAMEEAADRIGAAGGKAQVVTCDVRDPTAVQALVDGALESTGRLDIMVNNAGLSHPEPILEADIEGWRAMLETNVLALLVGSQAAVKAMRACGATGHIVNISSVAALRPDSGVYGATKHAVNTICNSLRKELEDDPIQVVNIMPGAIATNFARNFDPAVLQGMVAMSGLEAQPVKGERLPDDVLEAAQAALSDLLATPDDVADAVLYAVTRPPRVHVAEIVVRPNKDLNL
ncbi:MAG TPA: SDR family oxidoreductase [Acidimicrobiales bacterium]|jgi:NADP-dependent 3-hydroxy acid dehydrogenase YdfG|nr:SDR family oxidoreductase [Acidimicrobiales bacterium]